MEGKSVDLEETILGCERIMAGEFDDLSENNFYMIGRVEEAREKADIEKNKSKERQTAEQNEKISANEGADKK